MTLRAQLLRWLRVPHRPSAPAGDRDVRVFRAAENYLRYRRVRWVLTNAGAAGGVLSSIWWARTAGWDWVPGTFGPLDLSIVFSLLEVLGIAAVAIHAIASLALLQLDFEQRWYIVSDRSLRIRTGIVRMHEKTMTFANIQHVTIKQGPLQRLLGIADLQVRTAGGGGGASEENEKSKDDLHVAYFQGVADAKHIRDTIRDRLRRHTDAGLGDPDDAGPETTSPRSRASNERSQAAQRPLPTALVKAARALAEEATLLRAAF